MNLKFKLKLVKQDKAIQRSKKIGLYQQLKAGNTYVYDKNAFSISELEKALEKLQSRQAIPDRRIKLVTDKTGLELFNKALQKASKI